MGSKPWIGHAARAWPWWRTAGGPARHRSASDRIVFCAAFDTPARLGLACGRYRCPQDAAGGGKGRRGVARHGRLRSGAGTVARGGVVWSSSDESSPALAFSAWPVGCPESCNRPVGGRQCPVARGLHAVVVALMVSIVAPVGASEQPSTAVELIAVDTPRGCAVVRADGRMYRACRGEPLARSAVVLVEVGHDDVGLGLDGGTAGGGLIARLRIGERIDPIAARAEWRRVSGPRPGWIESPASGER
jgi:hypothetical protein